MRTVRALLRAVLAGCLFAGPVLGTAGCADREEPTLVVLGPWTDGEERSFVAMLAKITERTGVRYVYEGTRSLRETLVAQLRTDSPPMSRSSTARASSPSTPVTATRTRCPTGWRRRRSDRGAPGSPYGTRTVSSGSTRTGCRSGWI